jgi:hypothetical protein
MVLPTTARTVTTSREASTSSTTREPDARPVTEARVSTVGPAAVTAVADVVGTTADDETLSRISE